MFTGIITDIGTVQSVETKGDTRLRIETGFDTETIAIGASIACDGVCLTVVDCGQDGQTGWFDVDCSAETLSKTTVGAWATDKRVNLERSLRVGDEMGGHIVSGHVDGTAKIVSDETSGDSTVLTIEAPKDLAPFLAQKGSVALNGTSLTVNDVDGARFTINLIPHTKSVTTWGDVSEGDMINLEVDTLARYVARLNDLKATG